MSKVLKRSRTPNADRPSGARNKVFRAKREQRRLEAEARAASFMKTTPEKQLQYLDSAKLGAQKERTKISSLIASGHGKKTYAEIRSVSKKTNVVEKTS